MTSRSRRLPVVSMGAPGAPLQSPGRTAELEFAGVYRLDPGTGAVTLVSRELTQPNGLAFSPDEQTLYVSDTGSGRLLAFPVLVEGGLGRGRPSADGYDGLRVDRDGRVWATTQSGIVVTAPDGRGVARIATDTAPTALAWGGPDGTTLFVTTPSAVWSVPTSTTGAPMTGGQR